MSSDQILLDEYERRTLDLIAEIDGKRIAKEEGIILTIKSMLKKKIAYEDIGDITGKTMEEIKEIENSASEVE